MECRRPYRPRPLRALVLALALALAGCTDGSAGEEPGQVEVSGSLGSVPTVSFESPLPMEESRIEVLVEGDGRVLAGGEPVLFALTAYDGQDGQMLAERGAGNARTLMLTPEDVGEDLYPVLLGTAEGSRLLVRQPVTDDGADRMLLLVIDVLHTRARGTEVEVAEDLPQVELGADGAPSISVPDREPPTELVVARRIRGDGAQVRPGQHVTVQYTGVEWGTGELYDSTWEAGKVPQTVPIDETFPGLRDGLLDQPIGSQVLLVVPPGQAVGTETLVLVVDVLATSGGQADLVVPGPGEETPTGGPEG